MSVGLEKLIVAARLKPILAGEDADTVGIEKMSEVENPYG